MKREKLNRVEMENNCLHSDSLSKNSSKEFYGCIWVEGLGSYQLTKEDECPFCAIFPEDSCDTCDTRGVCDSREK